MNDLRMLLRFARPYKRLALLSVIALLAMVALDLAIPRLVERVIDEGIKQKDMGIVLKTSVFMLAISALSTVATILNSNWSIRVGEGMARDLREAIFVKIQELSYGDMDRFSTGKLMVRLTSDSGAVQRVVQISLRIGTRAPLTMIGSIALMFVTSPALASAMIPILLASAALIVLFSLKTEGRFRAVQQKLDRLNTVLQENIAGARLVKAFVRARHETLRFDAANDEFADDSTKVMQFMASMTPALTILVNAGMVLILWLGGLQAMDGDLSMGRIVAFTNYLLATLHPLTMMTQLSNTWANGLASATRVNEVLEAEPEVREAAGAIELPEASPCALSFRGVDFRYEEDSGVLVLGDIDLEVAPGQTVAILGATGSGKTSLVNLVPRFYDPSRGSVRIDGLDLRGIKEDSLLSRIGIVPQESVLFSGTVRDNIRYGKPEAGEDEIVAAAKAAQAHDFIMRLPLGYDSRVEERGANFSGGQKQRIAIARALVTRPSILILDDSTSAVDVETETKIQAALGELMRGRSCIVVAQRISTVLGADTIVVLDEGRIVAKGTHAELLRESAVYREIYDSQLGGGLS